MSSAFFSYFSLFFHLPLFFYSLAWLARGVRQPGLTGACCMGSGKRLTKVRTSQ